MEDKSKSVIEPNNLDKTLETKTEYQENSNMIDTPEQNLFEETQQEDSGYLSFDTASEYIYAEQSQAQGGNNNEQKSKLWLYILAGVLMVVCIVTVLLNAFVFIKIEIDGKSMENTLQHGDIVTANKVIDPDYGDIIVISGELYIDGVESWIVKRAIAFGGDSVKIENGLVYLKKQGELDFVLLDESGYLKEEGKTFYPDKNDHTDIATWEITIPQGEIFYLGDNRQGSSDSRYPEFSTCKQEQVVAVVEDWLLPMRPFNKFINKIFGKRVQSES